MKFLKKLEALGEIPKNKLEVSSRSEIPKNGDFG